MASADDKVPSTPTEHIPSRSRAPSAVPIGLTFDVLPPSPSMGQRSGSVTFSTLRQNSQPSLIQPNLIPTGLLGATAEDVEPTAEPWEIIDIAQQQEKGELERFWRDHVCVRFPKEGDI